MTEKPALARTMQQAQHEVEGQIDRSVAMLPMDVDYAADVLYRLRSRKTNDGQTQEEQRLEMLAPVVRELVGEGETMGITAGSGVIVGLDDLRRVSGVIRNVSDQRANTWVQITRDEVFFVQARKYAGLFLPRWGKEYQYPVDRMEHLFFTVLLPFMLTGFVGVIGVGVLGAMGLGVGATVGIGMGVPALVSAPYFGRDRVRRMMAGIAKKMPGLFLKRASAQKVLEQKGGTVLGLDRQSFEGIMYNTSRSIERVLKRLHLPTPQQWTENRARELEVSDVMPMLARVPETSLTERSEPAWESKGGIEKASPVATKGMRP